MRKQKCSLALKVNQTHASCCG